MKVITIIEDGKDGERARSIYVGSDSDVTVFDATANSGSRSTSPAPKGRADPRARGASHRACRVRLRRARFGVDVLRYSEDEEFYSPATILMGIDKNGQVHATTEILWIDAAREWVVREDGFWWTPEEEQ
jgi:hypothetical protein